MRPTDEFKLLLLIAAMLYAGIAMFAYADAHPWMTQTEVLQNAWRVLTWDW